MAVFIVQIGVMGVLCGRWPELGAMRWILYAWCWLLIDFQGVIAWMLAGQNWWADSLQTASLFVAQLGLLTIWAVLGSERWTVRAPLALVVGCGLMLFLTRIRYHYDSAVAMFVVQIVALGGICVVFRRKGYRLAIAPAESGPLEPLRPASALRTSQFGLRDVLLWTTALALVCGLVRAVGLPWRDWFDTRDNPWLLLFANGLALATALVITLWCALGMGRSAVRRYVPLLAIPIIGIANALVEWLVWLVQWRPWIAPWFPELSWQGKLYSAFWQPFSGLARISTAWLCLTSGMLFATLLFPRALGYRLIRGPEIVQEPDDPIAGHQTAGVRP